MENQKQDLPEMDLNADAEIPGSTHLTNPLEDSNELEQLNNELAEQKDKYLRLVAEFDNFRKRTANERVSYMQTAGKDVIVGLLDVLDDIDRAEKQINESDNASQIKEGVEIVFNKFRNNLQQRGLKHINVLNQDFDVDTQEAIAQVDAGEKMRGKVVEELQKGYSLNDNLIRFAKVVIGS